MPTPGRRPMTPQDLTRIRFVSDPQIAPDGTRVAFVVTTLDAERDEYLSNVWVVDVAGGEPRRLTTGPRRDTGPRWSPDGRRLAFLSEREGARRTQLFVMPADGGEAVRLTDVPNGVAAPPAWSPDGAHLAFTARVGGWQEPENEQERRTSRPIRVITTLKYRSNGEGFVYDRRPHVFVVAAGGGPPRQVTSGDFAHTDPVWSPDGRSLAFVSARHDERDHDDVADVWRLALEGGEPRRLTAGAGALTLPAFSPDGRGVAYVGRRGANAYGANLLVGLVPAEGGEPRYPSAPLDRTCCVGLPPVFTPDGRGILFAAEDHGTVGLFRVDLDGPATIERLVDGDRVVTGLSVARDGRIAFTATEATTPAEVFVTEPGGRGERRLTDLNRAWLDEVLLARPQRFRFERAGFTIDGWAMLPPAAAPGTRHPGLLNIHGGPHHAYGCGFFDEFQVYAGAGHAVVYTNPRGSHGYGEAFSQAVMRDWGGGDFADVMAGLDEALRRFDAIDPARLGVMGGSYGGFLTTWTVGHTDRFRAACSERAVNDLRSMFGTSDIGHLFNVAQVGALPWEDPGAYVHHSPLAHATRITTPLMIVHSEDDLRCPIEQAEQLFVILAKLRREVVFVRVPDENHELSRSGRPRHRLERFRLILDWFARHLQPGPR